MQAQVEIVTGKIVGLGEFPSGSPDPETIEIVDLTPEQEVAILADERGQRAIEPDGSVRIAPPADDAVQEARHRRVDALEAAAEAGDLAEVGRLVAAALREL